MFGFSMLLLLMMMMMMMMPFQATQLHII